jgi:hypothetical protein
VAIAQDISTPSPSHFSNNSSGTFTTGSFTPPDGSLVAVQFGFAGTATATDAPTAAPTVTDSLSNSYAEGVYYYEYQYKKVSAGTYYFYYATSPGAITITVYASGVVGVGEDVTVYPLVLTGCAADQTGAAETWTYNVGSSDLEYSITTTTDQSWVLLSTAAEANITPTADGLSTISDDYTGALREMILGQTTAAVTPPGATTLGWTISASDSWFWSALEILPAGTPPYIDPALNDFAEGAAAGGNGTTITFANSAGAGETALTVNIAGSDTITYSTDHTIHSAYSAKIVSNSGNQSYLAWNLGAALPQAWFRFYLYAAANPGGTAVVFGTAYNDGIFVGITSSGFLYAQDNSGHSITGTNAIPLNAWSRVEGYFLAGTGSGGAQLNLYDTPDSTVPTATLTSPTTWTIPNANLQWVGFANYPGLGTATWTYYLGAVGASNTGYLGPWGAPPSTAAIPPSLLMAPGWYPGMDKVAAVPGGIPFYLPPRAAIMSSAVDSPAAYATTYDVGSGAGSWVNPPNAEGPADGSYSTWTAP